MRLTAPALHWRCFCATIGSKHTKLPMTRFHLIAVLLIGAGVLAMGADNSRQLARCEATGRGPAECRLLVLGR
jgi:hypothetical protein